MNNPILDWDVIFKFKDGTKKDMTNILNDKEIEHLDNTIIELVWLLLDKRLTEGIKHGEGE